MFDNEPKTPQQLYFDLAKDLELKYLEKSYQNHCYWRIALDHVVGEKWDLKFRKPAYKYLRKEDLEKVVGLLERYLKDEDLLERHNLKSLDYRK